MLIVQATLAYGPLPYTKSFQGWQAAAQVLDSLKPGEFTLNMSARALPDAPRRVWPFRCRMIKSRADALNFLCYRA